MEVKYAVQRVREGVTWFNYAVEKDHKLSWTCHPKEATDYGRETSKRIVKFLNTEVAFLNTGVVGTYYEVACLVILEEGRE